MQTQAEPVAAATSIPPGTGVCAAVAAGRWAWLGRLLKRRLVRREPTRRQRGVAILVVLVTTAVIDAAAADFAYNTQVELEAAVNSRDSLRAEYMARSGLQLGQLLTAVQGSLSGMLQALPAEFRDAIVITDYAGFLAKVFGGDKESREGLGALLGGDLAKLRDRYELSIPSRKDGITLAAKPKAPEVAKLVTRLEMAAGPELWSVQRVVIEEPGGDRSVITFGRVQRDVKVDPARMRPPQP